MKKIDDARSEEASEKILSGPYFIADCYGGMKHGCT